MTNPAAQPPEKSWIVSQFEGRAPEAHGVSWSKIWDVGKSNLWDRGQTSPALVDIAEKYQKPGEMFHPFAADGRRKRVLVPGCGRGYDVVMLALHGFDAYGLDISATGVAAAEAFASKELQSPGAANFGPNHDNQENQSRGSVKFLEGNFFAPEWENEAGGKFDLIYDYTFLCALHPTMRKNWASRMASLLKKDGLLTCLEFPMYKDRKLPGPPWGLNGVHWNLLGKGGDGIDTDDATGTKKEGEGSFNRILYVQPERTHEAGQGTDMLSVYQRK